MHPLVNVAVKAARNAGKLIIRSLDRLDSLTVDEKGFNDFVTEIDRLAEQEIINTVREVYPNHAFLGEESGNTGKNDYIWVIDPLDGTTNYIHGFPAFSVSIGIKYKNKIVHGVIFNPLNGELFTATRGEGAYLNNHRLRVSKRTTLHSSLLGIGFPYKQRGDLQIQVAILDKLFPHIAGFRSLGSAALTLAYVAAGRLDGAFWISCLNEWDIAAGQILIHEAGGLVGDCYGTEDYSHGNLIIANPKMFKILLQTIKPIIIKKDDGIIS